ncbi:rhomboid family intramembrane serine protease [Avrilella dinanensis]|uniref:rhomboid family intramembrane serine protease n=1 Tax=Avrilella dinanensis TaxID=2008672 RepID=UPI0024092980|nr:rhomboid family intramembrane serine protease [Avrilella dinanensis]
MMQLTNAVKQILIVNIILFVGAMLVPALNIYLPLYYFENPMFGWWQMVSHMFMHGGLMHIFFNMFALVSFGVVLEHFWGSKKFVLFYFLCGLGAAVLHTVVNYWQFHEAYNSLVEMGAPQSSINSILESGNLFYQDNTVNTLSTSYKMPVVGASGAIYGLLVAFAFMYPNAELALMFIPVPIKAKYFVPAILLLDLILGLNGGSFFGGSTGIAHFAHLGGALVGFLLMWYWRKNQFNQNRWDRYGH